jgi:cell division protein FtsB
VAIRQRIHATGPLGLVYVAAVIALVVAVSSVADSRGISRLRLLRADCARQQAANDALREQNSALLRTIQSLGDPIDRAALERAAREQLGYVKQDEIVFKFE